ncbi:MAG: SLBB domain-containing protein [candidate division KSB1 bacterium]|nr:SLBB domain-containing protein [candidate division KSB1 bacterium]MDZ7276373.1 SLBB domain-containing protein [candidate division KSB1 bacterium]MDZ7287675.1 SLBB domain-containing protein [candidate division KSB1 bacterium]MDZ7299985.1 SLBB domain-containing protein [candidate division KSB1 bacterium]MDZ7307346.1 SLBB domain-containing protein [candidate division KSB1 bacterium]
MHNLVELVRKAGVVGAGGAGFPTYKKIDTRADTVIANGAECEPLLYKDKALLEHYAGEMVAGLRLVMQHVGAQRGIVAVKHKNRKSIQALTPHLEPDISIFEMEDVYPAGDEFEVVYHSTGRRIPAGGLPVQVGVVVQNVETLFNVWRAAQGHGVTHSLVTLHGHVKNPVTAWLPVGMSYGEALALAGGATLADFVLLDGGPMMGKVVTDLSTPVTAVTSGLIVLGRATRLAQRKSQSERDFKRIGKSACDQCSLCTELCPRYLLGYPIQPHLVMRSLLTTGPLSDTLCLWAQACCECNLCTLWACPEELDPRNMCVATKRDLKAGNRWLPPEHLQKLSREVHPLKAYRAVPTQRLMQRLGLHQFTQEAPLLEETIIPARVTIPLQPPTGVAAQPCVRPGDRVEIGDVLARPAANHLSVPVHASLTGRVVSVGQKIVIERE